MARSAKHIVHEIYSDVMFELAQETGVIDQVSEDLEAVTGILQSEPEFLSLLTLSEINPDEKAEMIRRVFKGQTNSLTLDFLCVLAKRNRINFLHGIGQRYQTLSDEYKNLHRIEVTLAKEPTDTELEKLRDDIRDAINAEIKYILENNPTFPQERFKVVWTSRSIGITLELGNQDFQHWNPDSSSIIPNRRKR